MRTAAGLNEPFANRDRQHQAATLGMWLFLATEILLFGGLFTGYAVMRAHHPETVAVMSGKLDLVLGTVNTAILLTSSLTMALAVSAVHELRAPLARWLLAATALLGLGFLAIKGLEWAQEAQHHLVPLPELIFEAPDGAPHAELFMGWYFALTGLHALHLTVGVCLVVVLWVQVLRRPLRQSSHAVEMAGLYWHLVDIIWVFLFTLLYLVVGR